MKTFRVLRVFLFLGILAAVGVSGQEGGLAIIGADVVNPLGKSSYPNATILIAGNRILQVGPSSRIRVPDGYRIIDARGKWVIPGLIDAHIHFFQSGGLYTRPDILDLRKYVSYEQEQSDIRKYLRDTFARYLRCGVTGVVDMGGPLWNFEVRARADTTLLAPRVVLTGPLISTYQPEKLMTNDPPISKIHSVKEARSLVQKEVASGADFIKIWYIVGPGQKAEVHYPLVQAVI
ncbi:MAG: amidohydrolase, partial [Calditrichaeota bacterium]